MVPGRPSPTKDFNRSTTTKTKNNSSSFESYQNSVSDAWTLSEDELTKEYCILSDETKVPRRTAQNIARAHKNPIAVVHNHRNLASTSTSSSSNSITNSATTANIKLETVEEDVKDDEKQKPERKVSTEYG